MAINKIIKHSVFRYLVVGVSAFLIEYVSFLLLLRVFDLKLVVSHITSLLLGFVVSFSLNKFWTFAQTTKNHATTQQIVKYLALLAVNLVLSSLIISLISKIIAPEISKFIVVAMVACWNYFIFKYYVFK